MELKHEFRFGKFRELKGLIFSKIPRVAILDLSRKKLSFWQTFFSKLFIPFFKILLKQKMQQKIQLNL